LEKGGCNISKKFSLRPIDVCDMAKEDSPDNLLIALLTAMEMLNKNGIGVLSHKVGI
jgi:hypothetical protein